MVKATESSIWLCGIFGGLMAGLLEEAGCFTVFKTVLKRNYIKAAVVLANFGVTR
ncbi:MAG: YhfC family glutamic-type intramembrane protease [Limnochordia bacterium]